MQKVTFKNSRQQTLAGNLFTADSKSIVIISHGHANDKSSQGRFDRLAKKLQQSGCSVLAFDFSGCGESADDSITLGKQVDDLQSAIRFVKEKGYDKIGLFGYSLGGLVSLKCYTPEISTIVLLSPLTDSLEFNWHKSYTKEQMYELKEKGYITQLKEDRIRKKMIIDKQLLIDVQNINQKELFKNIACPVLIIHGSETDEEKMLLEKSKKAMELLADDSRLEIIQGADHKFYEEWARVVQLTNEWFLKYLAIN